MEKKITRGVPKSIGIIIVLALASMFYYAAYLDTPLPEKAVKNFYQAYFEQDYDTVASYLSVFWAVPFLPEYHNDSPKELIAKRADIEKDIAALIKAMEEGATYPENLTIKINSALTKVKPHSALVSYTFEENGQESGTEVAILIFENGAYKIYNMSPAYPGDIEAISEENMQILDDNFKSLLEQE